MAVSEDQETRNAFTIFVVIFVGVLFSAGMLAGFYIGFSLGNTDGTLEVPRPSELPGIIVSQFQCVPDAGPQSGKASATISADSTGTDVAIIGKIQG